MSFTKNPMNPMIANPTAVAMAIRWNSVERVDNFKNVAAESFSLCKYSFLRQYYTYGVPFVSKLCVTKLDLTVLVLQFNTSVLNLWPQNQRRLHA